MCLQKLGPVEEQSLGREDGQAISPVYYTDKWVVYLAIQFSRGMQLTRMGEQNHKYFGRQKSECIYVC